MLELDVTSFFVSRHIDAQSDARDGSSVR